MNSNWRVGESRLLITTILVSFIAGSFRSSSKISRPVRFGSIMSNSTKSGLVFLITLITLEPSDSRIVSNPASVKVFVRGVLKFSSSSTTSIVFFEIVLSYSLFNI